MKRSYDELVGIYHKATGEEIPGFRSKSELKSIAVQMEKVIEAKTLKETSSVIDFWSSIGFGSMIFTALKIRQIAGVIDPKETRVEVVNIENYGDDALLIIMNGKKYQVREN